MTDSLDWRSTMFRSARVQMPAVLAVGALLGYAAASGKLKPFGTADAGQLPAATSAKLPGPDSRDKPACCARVSKDELLALADRKEKGDAEKNGGRPNILFIMGDDIGWMQPGCYHRGLMVGETPNIDRIA